MDMNLTRVFVAIYEARSLTVAAARLHVSQSAVSQALGRLRTGLDDALFVRAGKTMVPTPLSEAVYPDFRSVVATIDRTLDAVREFDPATTTTTFRIALSELGEIGWLPVIAAMLRTLAPAAHLDVVALRSATLVDDLTRGSIDAAVTSAQLGHELPFRVVKHEGYTLAMSPRHRFAGGSIDQAAYCRARRVRVASDSSVDLLDAAHQRVEGMVAPTLSVQHFASVPSLLTADDDLVAVLPETLADGWAATWSLATARPPFELPAAQLRLYRRNTTQQPAALEWFFDAVAGQISGDPGAFTAIRAGSADPM
ncbi:LysR family transcriptional regulator [Microbacterium sp.]|uniref:LysR family transcriptional regulator n=1 Tax=Microbacterium sp. TaxID=51671 RepID=UPI003A846511